MDKNIIKLKSIPRKAKTVSKGRIFVGIVVISYLINYIIYVFSH